MYNEEMQLNYSLVVKIKNLLYKVGLLKLKMVMQKNVGVYYLEKCFFISKDQVKL